MTSARLAEDDKPTAVGQRSFTDVGLLYDSDLLQRQRVAHQLSDDHNSLLRNHWIIRTRLAVLSEVSAAKSPHW